MQKHTIATRPAFVEARPELLDEHRQAQKAMFGAARRADLCTSEPFKDAMIDGINEALGLHGSRRLISRTQMTVAEMQAVRVAIEAGLFSSDWTWGNEFTISVTTETVRVEVVHITPTPTASETEARRFSRLLNS